MDDAPQRPADAILQRRIGRTMHCRACGYDLRGLAIGGTCPECGTTVWETVQHAIDPDARRLPMLRNPSGVGNGLLLLMSCLVLAALAVLAPGAADRIMAFTSLSLVRWTPPEAMFLGAAAAWTGLIGARKLAPPRGKEPRGAVWRDIWLLVAGLSGIGAACLLSWVLYRWLGWRGPIVMTRVESPLGLVAPLILLGSSIVTMLALGGILSVIGERSRVYRNAAGDRQRTREMIAALGGVALGFAIRQVAPMSGGARYLVIGDIVLFVSGLMLVIGLLYLLVNAWWIRRSLLRPPPTLEQLLR